MTAPITDEAWQQIVDGTKGVTPGPWAWESHGRDGTFGVGLLLDENDQRQTGKQPTGLMFVAESVAAEGTTARDAAYIARLSPPTILAIDARMKALEAEVGRLRLALIGIEEYWNREPSDGAMLDALDVIIYRARAALEASK